MSTELQKVARAAIVRSRQMKAYRKLQQAEAKGCQMAVAKARKAYFLSGVTNESSR